MAALNLDLFQPEIVQVPAPATLHTRIQQEAMPSFEVQSLADEHRETYEAELPSEGELGQLFDRYNWMYFGGKLPKPRIEYSNRMTTAGAYYPNQSLIKIGRKYHELFPDELADTLKHEMIHLVYLKHNTEFKAEAVRVGASVKARSHPSLRKPPRYLYECPECGLEYPRQKRLVLASCGYCSPSGKYDDRFKLRLKSSRSGRG
jgi:SprT-like protein